MIAPQPHCPDPILEAPAPCEGCRLAARCGAELLACDAFRLYYLGGGPARWALAPRLPSRREYAALLGGPDAVPVTRQASRGPPMADVATTLVKCNVGCGIRIVPATGG